MASNLRVLEVWLQAEIDYRDQPGCVVGIVYDKELIYAKAFGYADVASKRPMTTDALFHIGSQSKTFTTIAVLQLQEQGKLRLDDPVNKYVPGFAVKTGCHDAAPITIFQLLTHTSGLLSEGTKTMHWSDLDFPTREHIDEQIKAVDVAFPSGTKRKYSNLGVTLAGRIVENVSGKSFKDYVIENILLPLQMHSTYVELPNEQLPRLATGYGRRMPDGKREVMPFWDARGMAAAFGMFSNVTDLAKYVAWQMRLAEATEKEVLEPTTWRDAAMGAVGRSGLEGRLGTWLSGCPSSRRRCGGTSGAGSWILLDNLTGSPSQTGSHRAHELHGRPALPWSAA